MEPEIDMPDWTKVKEPTQDRTKEEVEEDAAPSD